MLGDLIYENGGKVIEMRRLSNGKIQERVAVKGRFLGEEYSAIYLVEGGFRPDGTGYTELHGLFKMKSR